MSNEETIALALKEWLDKTEWAQETGRTLELGMHRADVLRQRIAELEAAVAKERAEYQASMDHQNAMARQRKDRITELEAKLESYERDFLKVRVAMGLDLHSHDNLIDVAKRQCEQNKALLEALTSIAYGLEGARIWGGMDWTYNPLHPYKYLPLRDKVRAAIAAAEGK